jgi:hypothetical protein
MESVNSGTPSWASFIAWFVVGVALLISVVSLKTIGIFVFPFAIAGLLAVRRWGGNRKSSVGLIFGVGLPVLSFAYLNRGGPGMVCGPYKNGGQQCGLEYNPWPFLVVGALLVVISVVLFIRLRSQTAHVDAQLSSEGKKS